VSQSDSPRTRPATDNEIEAYFTGKQQLWACPKCDHEITRQAGDDAVMGQSVNPRKIGATPREARAIDWFRHPTGLPIHEVIKPMEAWWSVDDVMGQNPGLYPNRRVCLAELNRLRERGSLLKMGQRFRYRPSWWTGVMFT
jgi:hypothetical protein